MTIHPESVEVNTSSSRDGLSERLPIFEQVLTERLRPTVTPAMGFQSYEKLDGNREYREGQKAKFLAGEVWNPAIDYPKLDIHELDLAGNSLRVLAQQAGYHADEVASRAIQESAGYRLLEMEWLKNAARLDDVRSFPDSEEYASLAQRHMEMNEALYGKPDEKIVGKIYGEIFDRLDKRGLDSKTQKIYDEFFLGGTIHVAGEQVTLPRAADKVEGRLPEVSRDTLSTLGEVLREDTAFIESIVRDYVETVVKPRVEFGGDSGFTTDDMVEIFKHARDAMDPNNLAGIEVYKKEGSSSLAWNTPTMAVEIGESRAPILDEMDMVAKVKHELYVHGNRAVCGLSSDLGVLGTGLYSDSETPGGDRDYLTFEEGLAVITEALTRGDEELFNEVAMTRYMAVANAYDGMDFRETFEVNWRARVLIKTASLDDGESLTDTQIEKERKAAYLSVLRIRRGGPTEHSKGVQTTFNKDLAYLAGRIKVLDYLESASADKRAVRRLFTAKYDPTNKSHAELVARYGRSNGE